METRIFSLTLSYIGSGFHGFARQLGLPTVQGALEEALAVVFRRPIETVGAGRTDAGVHAYGQVVSFALSADEADTLSPKRLRNSLNALTTDGIIVRSVDERPAGFSARFSALEREYRYRIVASEVPALFIAPYVWWLHNESLDLNRMRQAVPYLLGEHDFRSFSQESDVDKNTVRHLKSIHIFDREHLGEPCLTIQVIGNAFLHSMVRIIVGSLVDIGYRRRDPEWLEEVLAARNRQTAGQTAPASGLTLWRVRY